MIEAFIFSEFVYSSFENKKFNKIIKAIVSFIKTKLGYPYKL